MKELVDIIRKEGGFRFSHRTMSTNLRFLYYCSQDQAREPESSGSMVRDVPKMARFPCQSSLTNRDQKAKGNKRFLREFAGSLTSTRKLVEEVNPSKPAFYV